MNLLTADDPSVDAGPATDADAGVEHDSDQEARLTLGEALLRDGADRSADVTTAAPRQAAGRRRARFVRLSGGHPGGRRKLDSG